MKLSKPLSALILIASALLLSAASSGATESASQPNQSSQTDTPAQQHNAISGPTVSALNKATAVPTTGAGATYIYNEHYYSSPFGNLPTWLEAVATIGLLIFACYQMRFVRSSTTAARDNASAAKEAAIATKEYAKIAALALNAERPYVFVESQELNATEASPLPRLLGGTTAPQEPQMDIAVSFRLRNRGKGVAVIKDVRARLLITDGMYHPVGFRRKFVTAGKVSLRIAERVVGGGEGSEQIVARFTILKTDWEKITHLNLYLLVAGLAVYGDVFRRLYTTKFNSGFQPPPPLIITGTALPSLKGSLFVAGERHNRFT